MIEAMPTQRPSDRLEASTTPAALTVRLSPSASVRFEREPATVRLLFGRSGIGPDVSFQPSAVDRVVRDQARLAGADPNRWCSDVLAHLVDWHGGLGWVDRRADRLVAAVGAFTHPLLGVVYQQGRAAVDEVPRWASSILRADDAGDAATRLVQGPTTRRVKRVFAAALLARPGAIDFERIGMAVATAGLVTDDELANLLEVAVRDEPLPDPLTVDEVAMIRCGLGWYPADRRAPLLIDVARDHRASELARALTRLRWVIDVAPRPLPSRLSKLTELCGRLVPVMAAAPAATANTPTPRTDTATPPTTTATVDRRAMAALDDIPHPAERNETPRQGLARRPARRPTRPGEVPRHAPAAPATAPSIWPVHPDLRVVNEHRVGDLTLCVPTSAAELGLWSRQLWNCLDSFGPAVAHGRSWVVGIRLDDSLVGAIEICPQTRRLRQAQGPRNRALPSTVYDRTITALGELGVLRTHSTSRAGPPTLQT